MGRVKIEEKPAKHYKRHLKALTEDVTRAIVLIDRIMREEASSYRRGKVIAAVINGLNMSNDQARYFGLGIDYRKDKKK